MRRLRQGPSDLGDRADLQRWQPCSRVCTLGGHSVWNLPQLAQELRSGKGISCGAIPPRSVPVLEFTVLTRPYLGGVLPP